MASPTWRQGQNTETVLHFLSKKVREKSHFAKNGVFETAVFLLPISPNFLNNFIKWSCCWSRTHYCWRKRRRYYKSFRFRFIYQTPTWPTQLQDFPSRLFLYSIFVYMLLYFIYSTIELGFFFILMLVCQKLVLVIELMEVWLSVYSQM